MSHQITSYIQGLHTNPIRSQDYEIENTTNLKVHLPSNIIITLIEKNHHFSLASIKQKESIKQLRDDVKESVKKLDHIENNYKKKMKRKKSKTEKCYDDEPAYMENRISRRTSAGEAPIENIKHIFSSNSFAVHPPEVDESTNYANIESSLTQQISDNHSFQYVPTFNDTYNMEDPENNRNLMRRFSTQSVDRSYQHKYGNDFNFEDPDWKHRVTVPKPFKMTLRDEKEKDLFKLNRSMKKLMNGLEEDEAKEQELINKQFRAKSVPKSTYNPTTVQIKRSIPITIPKEFNLTKYQKFPQPSDRPATGEPYEFKANPIPLTTYNNSSKINKMKHREIARKVESELRAEQMLEKMKQNESLVPRKFNSMKQKKSIEYSHKPKIKGFQIPDFKSEHQKLEMGLEQRKQKNRRNIKVEPFTLLSAPTPTKCELKECQEEIERKMNKFYKNENNQATNSTRRDRAGSADFRGHRTTQTQILRENVNRKKRDKIDHQEQMENLLQKTNGRKNSKEFPKLKEQLQDSSKRRNRKLKIADQREECKIKKQTFLKQQKDMEDKYRMQLQEMKAKLSERPLLCDPNYEQYAKTKTEERMRKVMERVGIDRRIFYNEQQQQEQQQSKKNNEDSQRDRFQVESNPTFIVNRLLDGNDCYSEESQNNIDEEIYENRRSATASLQRIDKILEEYGSKEYELYGRDSSVLYNNNY